jgi:hypothetical protein
VRIKTPSAALEQLGTAGEGIYPAVQGDPLSDPLGKPVGQRAFDKIPHEVADQDLVIRAGEQHMEEKVHGVGDWILKLLYAKTIRHMKTLYWPWFRRSR